MRNGLLIGLLMLLLAGVGWWGLGSDRTGVQEPLGQVEKLALEEPLESSGSGASATSKFEGRGSAGPSLRVAPLVDERASHLSDSSAEAPVEQSLREVVSGSGMEAELTFEGRVLVAGSRMGIAGVRIRLRSPGEQRLVKSDAAGNFEVEWPAGVAADLVVAHPAYVDLRFGAVDLAARSGAEFVMTPSGALEGRLKSPPGVALSAGRVDLWRVPSESKGRWVHQQITVDAEGRFAFEDLDPGEYALRPQAEGFVGRYVAGVIVGAGERVEVDLDCVLGAQLKGRLRFDELPELPTAEFTGTQVALLPKSMAMPRHLKGATGWRRVLDADGAFGFEELPPGSYRLVALLPWGARAGFSIGIDGSGQVLEREFSVAPPGALEGQVLDVEGRGVRGVRVSALGPKALAGLGSLLAGAQPESVPGTVTDLGGRFAFEALAAQEALLLVAQDEGRAPGYLQVAALGGGERRSGLIVQFAQEGVIQGRIREAAGGEGLGGVKVAALYSSKGREVQVKQVQTDSEGRYALDGLPPGTLRLRARAAGFMDGSARVDLAADGGPLVLDLDLERVLEVTGIVVEEGGAAVANLRVRASVHEDPTGLTKAQLATGPPNRVANSNRMGRFRMRSLGVDGWYLRPVSTDFEFVSCSPAVVTPDFLASGGEVQLTVRRLAKSTRARLEFAVREEATGLVPRGLSVKGAGSVFIDGGKVQVTGLEPVATRFLISARDCADLVLRVELSPGADKRLGLVQLAPGARVVVEVRDAAGEACLGAKVRLVREQQTPGFRGPQRLVLEHIGGGRYGLEGVAWGGWFLEVSSPGLEPSRGPLSVQGSSVEERVAMQVKR